MRAAFTGLGFAVLAMAAWAADPLPCAGEEERAIKALPDRGHS